MQNPFHIKLSTANQQKELMVLQGHVFFIQKEEEEEEEYTFAAMSCSRGRRATARRSFHTV